MDYSIIMINELQTMTNFEKYVQRMAAVKDKDSLISMIEPYSKVLDYGCGSGIMAEYFEPNNYVGYDISREMVNRAEIDHPGYTFTDNLRNQNDFDTVMFSSILHEIYSYNNNSYDEVVKSLVEVKKFLNPNGEIVIRDGIMPISEDYAHAVELREPKDAEKFLSYLREGPQNFDNITIDNGILHGSMVGIINFLNVYTWGWNSAPRERMERVNFATEEQWNKIFNRAGLTIVESNIIKQDSYFDNLNKIVDLNGLMWSTKAYFKLSAK